MAADLMRRLPMARVLQTGAPQEKTPVSEADRG